ncbi:IclR family transcriptional regulator [Phaeobacter inhibens]|uniref:IclR family transcriptional regulator n=1 Tax=Phaeobacter inhibens TaxID=221822 RepID=UPI00275C26F7|nr:IclR family transcriptional regulator [Phaeobacter inhibens]GLO72647.1 IclR family transcriptional regulator [Phaeobacter inhibens]
MSEKQNTLYVSSLAKGLKLLRAFDETATEMSLGDLSRRSGLDKSATQRLANTLHIEGMLDKDPVTKRFRPSHAWLEMAYAYFWSDPLVGLAMPKLIELSQLLGATVNLAELSGDHILYVCRLPNRSSQFSSTLVGRRLPALNTAAGRVMLSTRPKDERDHLVDTWTLRQFTPRTTLDREAVRASVDEAAQLGYATTQNQMILNQTGVSAPIIGPDGLAHASVHCSVSSHHWSHERILEELLPHVLEAAISIAPQSRGS